MSSRRGEPAAGGADATTRTAGLCHLVRHADARARGSWNADDLARPLTGKGRRQALGIAERLSRGRVERLVSSPALRCTETLAPLGEIAERAVEVSESLVEGADWRRALDLLIDLGASGGLVACTHGDVISAIAGSLAVPGVDGLPDNVSKGAELELEILDGRIGAVRYVAPPARPGRQ